MKGVIYMFKFRGKKWKDMSFYEKVVFFELVHKWTLPIRIIVFPIALLVKLYKWTYSEKEGF